MATKYSKKTQPEGQDNTEISEMFSELLRRQDKDKMERSAERSADKKEILSAVSAVTKQIEALTMQLKVVEDNVRRVETRTDKAETRIDKNERELVEMRAPPAGPAQRKPKFDGEPKKPPV